MNCNCECICKFGFAHGVFGFVDCVVVDFDCVVVWSLLESLGGPKRGWAACLLPSGRSQEKEREREISNRAIATGSVLNHCEAFVQSFALGQLSIPLEACPI